MVALLIRLVVILLALVVPGGIIVLLALHYARRRPAAPLDFDDRHRRVPATRRGQHTPILH